MKILLNKKTGEALIELDGHVGTTYPHPNDEIINLGSAERPDQGSMVIDTDGTVREIRIDGAFAYLLGSLQLDKVGDEAKPADDPKADPKKSTGKKK